MKYAKKKGSRFAKRQAPIGLIIIICLSVAVLAGALVVGYKYLNKVLIGETAKENVYVVGVDIGAMSKEDADKAIREAIGNSYETTPMVVQIDDMTISLTPELTGAKLDVAKAIELAMAAEKNSTVDILSCLNLNTQAIEVELQNLMANFSTQLTQPSYAITGADGKDKTIDITMGTAGYSLTYEDVYAKVMEAYSNNEFSVVLASNPSEPNSPDLDAIYAETYIQSADAVYDSETQTVKPHIFGYSFDLAAAKAKVAAAAYGETVSIPLICTKPAVLQEDLDDRLFKDVLATYTAKSGSVNGRDTNLRLACEAINGVVLQPGEVFSYNDTLGERTAEKGYQYGATYVGTKTVSTIGGGICQVSSTLYYCTLMADMEIVERTNHTFLNTYVPMGMDATVNWGGPNFRFKNNSAYPIRIEASANAGHTTVTIYGTDDKDYYVKMEYEHLDTYYANTVYEEMAADNEDGYKDGDVITTSYTGYKVASYRCKYDKKTDELISRVQESMNIYSKRDKVICKIITEETPTEPSEPTEGTESTDPPVSEPTDPPVSEPTDPPVNEPTDDPSVTEPDPPVVPDDGGISPDE